MNRTRKNRLPFLIFLGVAVLSFLGLVYIYLDTYYLRSFRTVGNKHDPQLGAARAVHQNGRLLHTLDLKRLFDLGSEAEVTYIVYDAETRSLVPRPAGGGNEYLIGDLVIAYKFGYGNAKSFSKFKNFLRYPTLLYSTFPVPGWIGLKSGLIGILLFSGALALLFGLLSIQGRRY